MDESELDECNEEASEFSPPLAGYEQEAKADHTPNQTFRVFSSERDNQGERRWFWKQRAQSRGREEASSSTSPALIRNQQN